MGSSRNTAQAVDEGFAMRALHHAFENFRSERRSAPTQLRREAARALATSLGGQQNIRAT